MLIHMDTYTYTYVCVWNYVLFYFPYINMEDDMKAQYADGRECVTHEIGGVNLRRHLRLFYSIYTCKNVILQYLAFEG